MKSFQASLKRLEAADTQVLGVSMDSPFANKAWGDQIGVTFPLLSDWFNGGKTTKEYGAWEEEDKAAHRITYLIDKSGKIAEVEVDSIDPTKVVESCERRKLGR